MKKYKRLTGPTYFFTDLASEIPKKTARVMSERLEIDLHAQTILGACGIDQLMSRGNFWVVVTEDRIAAFKAPVLHQHFFSDLTGVERSFTGDIVLMSAGNKSDLFHIMAMPNKKLIDRVFAIIQKQWLAVRAKNEAEVIHPTAKQSRDSDAVGQLERLAELKELGILTASEFQKQKEKLLAS